MLLLLSLFVYFTSPFTRFFYQIIKSSLLSNTIYVTFYSLLITCTEIIAIFNTNNIVLQCAPLSKDYYILICIYSTHLNIFEFKYGPDNNSQCDSWVVSLSVCGIPDVILLTLCMQFREYSFVVLSFYFQCKPWKFLCIVLCVFFKFRSLNKKTHFLRIQPKSLNWKNI